MKPYIFLFLGLSLALTSCFQDCTPQDVKLGNISLMPTTKAFVQQFVGKKVVYKNANGREIIFNAQTLMRDSDKVNVKINCNSGFTSNSRSWDFFQTEGMAINLISDSFTLSYKTWMAQNPVIAKSDTNNLIEVMVFSVYDKIVSCGVSPIAIFSDRGFPARRTETPDTYRRFREVKDTTVGAKRFQNINVRTPTGVCDGATLSDNQSPVELFFNFKEGMVAFKTKNGAFWFFDRIE